MDNKSSNIDIKSLRIGSHILVNGVRARVEQLSTLRYDKNEAFHLLVRGISPDTGKVGEVGCFVNDEAVEPIAITSELLKELGFGYLHKSPDDFKKLDKGFLIKFYRIRDSQDNEWRIIAEGRDGVDYGQILCRYLHEAEAFLYLTTQTELIPD